MKTFRKPLTAEEIALHRSKSENESPSVYIGTYGKYNDGSIFGMWVDITTFDTYDELREFGARLHADEADPELMFQDYEYFPREYYGESSIDFDKIIEYSELDSSEREAFDAYAEYESEPTVEKFRDCYRGQYDSTADFTEEYFTQLGDFDKIPQCLQCHIDWSSVWNELKGDFWENNGYFFAHY